MSTPGSVGVSERESMQVAEASRQKEWTSPSFLRQLFLGNFRLDLIHPYPLARRERPDMRIIFISGYAEDAFRKSMGSAANEIEFLPKPFSLKQLASKVKDVMRA